jgi:hypothetical protein
MIGWEKYILWSCIHWGSIRCTLIDGTPLIDHTTPVVWISFVVPNKPVMQLMKNEYYALYYYKLKHFRLSFDLWLLSPTTGFFLRRLASFSDDWLLFLLQNNYILNSLKYLPTETLTIDNVKWDSCRHSLNCQICMWWLCILTYQYLLHYILLYIDCSDYQSENSNIGRLL